MRPATKKHDRSFLALGETLAARGGTAAILRDQAPESLAGRDYADAFVVSTENTLS
jgi:hypothetical protein